MATKSKQPRFTEKQVEGTYLTLMEWGEMLEEAPQYKPDTRERDVWLVNFWKNEPHLQGVIHSIVSIDANRGWTLTGGRNQTLRFTQVLHDWVVGFGLKGWRPGIQSLSTSYLITDFGGIAEVAREGKSGPTRRFYHLDPTRCLLTNDEENPVKYIPGSAKARRGIFFREMDAIHVVSMPDIREEFHGAGWCFLSRAEVLVKLMYSVWCHDLEELGAAAPKGLLLISGITEKQFRQAMEGRNTDREGMGWRFYNAVQVLANPQNTVDAKLIALSQLPSGFNLRDFVSIFMYGLALCAGYDPSEFYPVQFGSLGRGTEMEVQHEKATGKGGRNFSLALQEQFQRPDILPETLHFEFEERDEAAELETANVLQAFATAFKTMRETGLQTTGVGGISDIELRQLYAEKNMIPAEWAEAEVPEIITDEDEEGVEDSRLARSITRQRRIKRDELLSKPHIWRTINAYPKEALVRYKYPANKIETLWESGEALVARMIHPAIRIKRQDESEVLYKSGDIVITENTVKNAIEAGRKRVGDEFASLLDNQPIPNEEGQNE